jgi:hypothetical protein
MQTLRRHVVCAGGRWGGAAVTTTVPCYHCHQHTLEIFGSAYDEVYGLLQQARCLSCGAGCDIHDRGSVYVLQTEQDEGVDE